MQLNPFALRKAKSLAFLSAVGLKEGKKTLINIQIKAALWKTKVSVSAPNKKG